MENISDDSESFEEACNENSNQFQMTPGVSRSVLTGNLDIFLSPKIDDDESNFKFYDVDCERVLLALRYPCRVYFYGCVRVISIAGSFEAFGYSVKPENAVTFFSLPGSSALYISTQDDSTLPEDFGVGQVMKYGLPVMEATKLFNSIQDKGCLVLMERDSLPYHISSDQSSQFLKCTVNKTRPENILGINLDRPGSKINKMSIGPELNLQITQSSKVIVCGGKGVGKSTTLLYLINRALNGYQSILYLDFDIGQPEFTLPECISAVIIDKPLLGPCYTHFKKPNLSYYLGDTNPTNCIDLYLKAVRSLVNSCSRDPLYSGIPWFVNTMGFSSGIGVLLTSTIIQCVQPTLLIQIEGKHKNQNFPHILKTEQVAKTTSEAVNPYKVITLKQFAESSKKAKSLNKEMRWLRIQAYFNSVHHPSYPLICPSSLLKVIDTKSKLEIKQHHHKFLTTKVVAFSTSTDQDVLPSTLDYGVVLAYEDSINSFIIQTPLPSNDDIKTIFLGSLQIPSQLNKAVSETMSGSIPYTHTGFTKTAAFKPVKRSHRFLFDNV